MLNSLITFLHQIRLSGGALLLIAIAVGVLVARGCHTMAGRSDPRTRLFLILSSLNLSLLVLLYALPRVLGEKSGVIAALSIPPPMLYEIPSVLLLSVSFLRQYRDLLPLNGSAVALGLWALMGFRFAVTAPPDTNRTVSVVSWNLAGKSVDLHGIMNGIRSSSPDIVCLQAVPADAALTTRLPAYHWYQSKGLAIGALSEIDERSAIDLASSPSRAIEGDVTLHGQDFTVVDCDLGEAGDDAARAKRDTAVKKLHTALADKKRRLVVAMALGAPSSSPEYQTLAQGLIDSFEQAGTGFGYTTPAKFPVKRTDFLLITPDCATRSAGPLNLAFSDHLPTRAIVGRLLPQVKTAFEK